MQIWIQNNGKLLGPLEDRQASVALEQGILDKNAQISRDRSHWVPISHLEQWQREAAPQSASAPPSAFSQAGASADPQNQGSFAGAMSPNMPPGAMKMGEFCMNCGQTIALETPACPHCGCKTGKARNYCRFCGNPLLPNSCLCPVCGQDVRVKRPAHLSWGIPACALLSMLFGILGVGLSLVPTINIYLAGPISALAILLGFYSLLLGAILKRPGHGFFAAVGVLLPILALATGIGLQLAGKPTDLLNFGQNIRLHLKVKPVEIGLSSDDTASPREFRILVRGKCIASQISNRNSVDFEISLFRGLQLHAEIAPQGDSQDGEELWTSDYEGPFWDERLERKLTIHCIPEPFY